MLYRVIYWEEIKIVLICEQKINQSVSIFKWFYWGEFSHACRQFLYIICKAPVSLWWKFTPTCFQALLLTFMHQVNVKICRGNLLSFLILAFSSLFRINEDLIRIINCERGRRRRPRWAPRRSFYMHNRQQLIKSLKMVVETSDKNQYSYFHILNLFLKMTWPKDK